MLCVINLIILFCLYSAMSTNMAFDSGDEQNHTTQVTKRGNGGNTASDGENSRSPPAYAPDEGTFLAGPQTYFADEKIIIPDIDKVRVCLFDVPVIIY